MIAKLIISNVLGMAIGSCATALAIREDWWWVTIPIWLGALLVWTGLLVRWGRMATIVVIIGSLLAMPVQAQEPNPPPPEQGAGGGGVGGVNDPVCGAGGVVAVVVVVVAGYCIYKLVKFCQEKFPKHERADKEDELSEDLYSQAASFNFGEIGSCPPCLNPPKNNSPVTVQLSLSVSVNEEGEVSLAPTFTTTEGEKSTQTFAEFAAEIQQDYGVVVTGHAGSEYFAANGNPIPKEESRIKMDDVSQLIKIDDGEYSVVIERSFDLMEWTKILHTEVNAEKVVTMIDTTPTGQAFYRFYGYRSD